MLHERRGCAAQRMEEEVIDADADGEGAAKVKALIVKLRQQTNTTWHPQPDYYDDSEAVEMQNVVYRSPYVLVLSDDDVGDVEAAKKRRRPFYKLKVTVALCNKEDKLRELQTRVAAALPPKWFSLCFTFDYIGIANKDAAKRAVFEKALKDLVAVKHFEMHKNQFTPCGTDLIYV